MGQRRALGRLRTIEAEEKGITSQNLDEKLNSNDPDAKRMLGATPAWARRSVSTRNGPTTRSNPSAITARSSSAMSATSRRSSWIVAPMICGRAAG